MPDRERVLKVGDDVVVLPGRNIDQIFLMSLCLVVSFPILIGVAPSPGTLNEVLPKWQVVAWSLSLFVGSAVVLLSYLFKDRINGIIMEQFGSICLASAAVLYAVAIFTNDRSMDRGGAVSASIILGFGLARVIQFRQHQKTLKRVRTVMTKIEEGEVNGV